MSIGTCTDGSHLPQAAALNVATVKPHLQTGKPFRYYPRAVFATGQHQTYGECYEPNLKLTMYSTTLSERPLGLGQ